MSSSERTFLFAGLCVGCALRLLTLWNSSAIEMDGIYYAQMGELFSQGAFREALKGVFPPFYPALIGLFRLFVPDLELAGRLVSLFAGFGLIGVSYLFFRELVDRRKALWGSFFVAIHPYLIACSGLVLTESVAALLFTCVVFFFYLGWTRTRGWEIALSGLLLSFTYLTRPEYVIYAVPLLVILVAQKRYSHGLLFLLAFSFLVMCYVGYMRMETGMIVVSKKALLMKGQSSDGTSVYLIPMPGLFTTFRNALVGVYRLTEAIFFPFVALGLLSLKGIERRFKMLTVFLVLSHVLSLALLTSSIRRFSVPLAGFAMVFVAEGFAWARAWASGFRHGPAILYGFFALLLGLSVYQGIDRPNPGRALDKEAGLFLLKADPGSRILSRLPLVSFYSRGEWIALEGEPATDCGKLGSLMREKGIKYLVLDERTVHEHPALNSCLSMFSERGNFEKGRGFVRIYRLNE